MRRRAFLCGAASIIGLAGGVVQAAPPDAEESNSVSDSNRINDVLDVFNGLGSWVDFPDDYVQSVMGTASGLLSGHDGVNGHFVVIVDRSVHRQAIFVVLVSKDGGDWNIAYQGHVSTGKPGRKEHFLTPVGVFALDGSILDYRAEGTFNQNHIRGIGLKGSRVWDFGWQETDDWRTKGAKIKIRMEMHATDPANLEHRIGRSDSEGCIRIHADLNAAMDQYGVLDMDAGLLAMDGDARWKQVLGRSHVYLPEAGRYLVVMESEAIST